MTEYKFRTVVLPFSGLEVQGEDWDEFYANLVAVFNSEDLAKAYMGMRRYEVEALVDSARNAVTNPGTTTPEQGVRNVQNDLGGAVLCDGHMKPASRNQVKKDGPNKGRSFYGCANPKDSSCGFFQWV